MALKFHSSADLNNDTVISVIYKGIDEFSEIGHLAFRREINSGRTVFAVRIVVDYSATDAVLVMTEDRICRVYHSAGSIGINGNSVFYLYYISFGIFSIYFPEFLLYKSLRLFINGLKRDICNSSGKFRDKPLCIYRRAVGHTRQLYFFRTEFQISIS